MQKMAEKTVVNMYEINSFFVLDGKCQILLLYRENI